MAALNGNTSDNKFWLQMFGDYARFILEALPLKQTDDAQKAQYFITQFDNLYQQASGRTNEQEKALNQQAYTITQDFRRFVLSLLKRQFTESYHLNVEPTLENHMVYNTEIYLNLLNNYIAGSPRQNPCLAGAKWLLNLFIGITTVEESIGIMHLGERIKAGQFAFRFLDLYFQATIIFDLRHAGLGDFPAIHNLADEIQAAMTEYAEYLGELMKLIEQNKILGRLSFIYLDNFSREICYFLTQINSEMDKPKPQCYPDRPRREF